MEEKYNYFSAYIYTNVIFKTTSKVDLDSVLAGHIKSLLLNPVIHRRYSGPNKIQ